jgi:ssDNA-binding Zn-finger/Zn-ribbon topoisomerase 1
MQQPEWRTRKPDATSLERIQSWLQWGVGVPLCIATVVVVALDVRNLGPMILLVIVFNFIDSMAGLFLARRARRIILKHDFRICPRCRYFLHGLPDEGSCPECGNRFGREQLVSLWKKRYRLCDAVDWQRCLKCRYSLKGLADSGMCPECGERYSRRQLLRAWGIAKKGSAP